MTNHNDTDTGGREIKRIDPHCDCGSTGGCDKCIKQFAKPAQEKEYDFICECGKHKRKDEKWI